MKRQRHDPDGYDNLTPTGYGETDLMRNVQRLATTVWPDLRDLEVAARHRASRGPSEEHKLRMKRFGPMQTTKSNKVAR